jgi:nucleoside-diphosphate-sugar epimerase
MQPVYVGNAANATLRAVDRLFAGDAATNGRTFFIADHAPGNFFDWMAPIMAGIGYPLPQRRLPERLARVVGTGSEWFAKAMGGRPAISRSSVQALCETITVDDSETRKVLGYDPPYSYDEAVSRTVVWFKQQANKSNTV